MEGVSITTKRINIQVPIRSGMYTEHKAKINVSAQEMAEIKRVFSKRHPKQVFPETRFAKVMKWVAEELANGTPVGRINAVLGNKLERARKNGVENIISKTTLNDLMPTRFKHAGRGARIDDENLPDSLADL